MRGLSQSYFRCADGSIVTCDAGNCPCPDTAPPPYVPPPQPTGYSVGPAAAAQLSTQARAAIEAAGHTISCAPETGFAITPAGGAPPIMCSVDGGPATHMASAINIDPGVLLVELGARSPVIAMSATGTTTPHILDGHATPTVTLSNLSRLGQPFQVGDRFRVTVVGEPRQPVSVSATQNSQDLGTTAMGSTDGHGLFTSDGQMAAGHVGDWQETWHVGAANTALLSFTVGAPAGAPGGGAPVGGGTTDHGGAGPSAGYQVPGLTDVTEFLKKPAFDGVPWWGVLAGMAAAAAFVFSGRRT